MKKLISVVCLALILTVASLGFSHNAYAVGESLTVYLRSSYCDQGLVDKKNDPVKSSPDGSAVLHDSGSPYLCKYDTTYQVEVSEVESYAGGWLANNKIHGQGYTHSGQKIMDQDLVTGGYNTNTWPGVLQMIRTAEGVSTEFVPQTNYSGPEEVCYGTGCEIDSVKFLSEYYWEWPGGSDTRSVDINFKQQ